MPGWHKLTEAWRKSGRLQIVGITQEQHPARCRLFAQWQKFDWPILWDPFNLTGTKVVPTSILIDEHLVVRSLQANARTIEAEFLSKDFEAPAADAVAVDGASWVATRFNAKIEKREAEFKLHGSLWSFTNPKEPRPMIGLRALELAARYVSEPRVKFWRGVALRMHYDSGSRRRGEFQGALNEWRKALDADPNQYIWRRRIQQYGPRMDKPYPFYDWVERAQKEIAARGEAPVALRAALTAAERAMPARSFEGVAGDKEPDPKGKIHRVEDAWLEFDAAHAFRTGKGATVARIHVSFRPGAKSSMHWNNEAEPMRLWFDSASLPKGAKVERNLLEVSGPDTATSVEERRFEWDLALPDGAGKFALRGYALFNACDGAAGQCLFLRRDFEIEINPVGHATDD